MSAERSSAERFAPLGLVVVGAWLAVTTWRAWPDAIVDFGRELYVPWRIVEGDRLYADLAYFNGPLSAYWNAMWFALFGSSLATLAWANALFTAAFAWLLHRTLERLGGLLAAFAGTLFFLVTFAFGQTSGVGNYCFLAPYSHEATHGLFLVLAALALLGPGSVRAAGAGACLGLAFLTKAEVFAAGALAVAVALWVQRDASTARARLAFVAALVGVPLVAGLALSLVMPAATAWRGLLGSWPDLVRGTTLDLPFYRGELGMGIDEPLANLTTMVLWTAGLVGFVGAFAFAGRRLAERGVPATTGGALALFVGVAVLVLLPMRWGDVGRPLPLVTGVLVVFAWREARKAAAGRERELAAARLGFLVLALALLAKMALAAKLWHYGFVLALPACMALVLALLCWLPARTGDRAGLLRGAGLALVAFVGVRYWSTSAAAYEERVVDVGTGTDRFRADVRGVFVNTALAEVAARCAPGDTLLVLPEGIMLNYLARRRTPTRHLNFMPPEVLLFGEERMLAELEAAPPDAVLLVHKDTSEYGLPLFGRDYGRTLLAFVEERYERVWTDERGDPPLEPGSGLGTALLLPR